MRAIGPTIEHARGTSWLHRANPLVKVAWLMGVLVAALATYQPVPLLVGAALGLVACVSAGIGRNVMRGLLVLGPVGASILVIQTLAPATCGGHCDPTTALGPLPLYGAGVVHGLSLVGRIVVVEVVALAVLMTTHPSDLFAALARLRVPYLVNLMLSMTLQLVPILEREVAIVLAAQRSRAMRGNGFAAILPSFIPVFVGAFERVQRLAIALESRGFGSTAHPTSYRRMTFGALEACVSVAGLALGLIGAVVGISQWGPTPPPSIDVAAPIVLGLFIVAGVVFVGVVAVGVRNLLRA
jgi:energy-coupling factor transport system permease protein